MGNSTTNKPAGAVQQDATAPASESSPPTNEAAGPASDAVLQRLVGAAGVQHDAASQLRAHHLKNAAIDEGGLIVGEAEAKLPFFRYHVTAYEAKVSDKLYRGSRLDAASMASLKSQGITGVVNLCLENDTDAPLAAQLGLHPLHIPILDNTAPTITQIKQFLDFVASNDGPVYVHCEAGEGRTGVMCAAYRMAVQGWTAEAALAEAKQRGMSDPVQWDFVTQLGQALSNKTVVF